METLVIGVFIGICIGIAVKGLLSCAKDKLNFDGLDKYCSLLNCRGTESVMRIKAKLEEGYEPWKRKTHLDPAGVQWYFTGYLADKEKEEA